MNKDINLKKYNFQKFWKIYYNPNVIIPQSKELTKYKHDMMIKNWYKTNNILDLIFYTKGSKTENGATAVIFVFNFNQYQYYKHQMTYQNITCFDYEKIMKKNWNLKKNRIQQYWKIICYLKDINLDLKDFSKHEKNTGPRNLNFFRQSHCI